MRLLYRFGLELDVVELDELAVVDRPVVAPKDLEGFDIFVGGAAAAGIGSAENIEFLLQSTGADAEDQAALR